MKRITVVGFVFALALILAGCGSKSRRSDGDLLEFAFITNGVAGFWEYAEAGAKKAGEDLGVQVTVIMPNSMTDQTRKIEDLIVRGTDGIAVSPIESANQIEILNRAAAETNLITHDSDAPDSNRQVYIGMDNYDAGVICGETLRNAMPEGGKVMIFIGRMDQDNAKRRRQGFIDGFLGRAPDRERIDGAGELLLSEGDEGKYQIVGTMTDQFDRAKAKANVEDAMIRHPDLKGMVGLFEYNPQLILEALERVDKLGKIRVMAFDENPATLQGIEDGTVVATVVQNPFQYGYKSIEILNQLYGGKSSAIPKSKFIDIPARVIDKSNVAAFAKETQDLLDQ